MNSIALLTKFLVLVWQSKSNRFPKSTAMLRAPVLGVRVYTALGSLTRDGLSQKIHWFKSECCPGSVEFKWGEQLGRARIRVPNQREPGEREWVRQGRGPCTSTKANEAV